MSFKKTKLVMLSTGEKAPNHDYLFLYKPSNRLVKDGFVQNLYFLSDEEIKEGDWFIMNGCIIRQCKSTNNEPHTIHTVVDTIGGIHHVSVCKKIISTTDNSLEKICEYESGTWLRLPQPSTSFIEKFVEEHNKGNVITEVLVEYEFGSIAESYFDGNIEKLPLKLKINPKDNTITIRKVKDSWNRDEVRELLITAYSKGRTNRLLRDFNEWLKENL